MAFRAQASERTIAVWYYIWEVSMHRYKLEQLRISSSQTL